MLALFLAAEIEVAQAVPDFVRHVDDAHSVLNHQLAGNRLSNLSSLPEIVVDAAVLAIFVPAETSVGNTVLGEILKAAEQAVVLRNLELFVENLDREQLFVGMKKRSGRTHAFILKGKKKGR